MLKILPYITLKMLWIVITSPNFFDGEARFISRLLAHGVDIVHLRKPKAQQTECEHLLDKLTADERKRIVIHDFLELAEPYGLRGIHLNSRRNNPPEGFKGHISRSCHSLEEVKKYKNTCSYVFLSPIFDSVSKQGYISCFTDKTLRQAASEGIIDKKVVALGGIVPSKTDYLKDLGFGGAAMLGCISNLASMPENRQINILEDIRRNIKG